MNLPLLLRNLLILTAVPMLSSISYLYLFAMTSETMSNLLPAGPYAGDSVIPDATMVYDQSKLIRAPPEAVWSWVLQIGKGRGGWYTPSSWNRILPRSWHATKTVHTEWQDLKPGDRVDDYGFSSDDYFIVEDIVANKALVYKSDRYGASFSWALMLHKIGEESHPNTLLHLRFRGRIAATGLKGRLLVWGGGWIDHITTAPMLAGLAERAEKGW